MSTLSKNNQNQINQRLQFDEKRHLYLLDDKKVVGTTTVLGVISKPALIPWASNQAVDYIQDAIRRHTSDSKSVKPKNIELPTDNWDNMLKEARRAYAQKRDKAGDVGSLVHKCIEQYINRKLYDPKISKQAHKMINNFKIWARENKVEFLGSEQQVYSEKNWYAGTFDFLCTIDGKTYLGDVKTSSGIYPEMFFQCAAYQIAYEEMNPKVKIDGSIIVNLKKDGTINEKRSISNKTNKEAFLAALCLYRAMNKVAGTVLQK